MIARVWSALLVATTFTLVLLGGLVHTRGASLACPDWPLCYGMVMPPMEGDILLEHGHRLLASAVGLMVIGQCVLVYLSPAAIRGRLMRPALLGLGLVLLQGTLGGLTVLWRLPPPVSIAHWSLSMLFFAWSVVMAWRLAEAHRAGPAPVLVAQSERPALPGHQLVWAAAIFVWAQGVLGSAVRHTHASLACGQQGLFCGDGLWPSGGPQWLQTSHRLMALVALGVVGYGTAKLMKAARLAGQSKPRRLGRAVHVLLLLQVVFGWLTVTSGVKLHSVMSHVAGAALLIGTLVAMGLSARPPQFRAGAPKGAGHGAWPSSRTQAAGARGHDPAGALVA